MLDTRDAREARDARYRSPDEYTLPIPLIDFKRPATRRRRSHRRLGSSPRGELVLPIGRN